MIRLIVNATPVPWAAHKGYGRRAYNPRHAERLEAQWQLKNQWKEEPIEGPVKVRFNFFLPWPKSKKSPKTMPIHVKKPDCTNLQKFMEDVLKGIVIKDDSQVVQIQSDKYWSDKEVGLTQIYIEEVGK